MANDARKNALRARLAAQRAVIEALAPFLPTPEGLDDEDDWQVGPRDVWFSPQERTLRPLLFGQAKSHPTARLGEHFDEELTVVKVKGRLLAHLHRDPGTPDVRGAALTVRVGEKAWIHPVSIKFQDEDNLYLDLGTEDDLDGVLRPARTAVEAAPDAPILLGVTLSYDDADPTPERR